MPHGKPLGSIVTEVTNATDLDNPLVLQLPRSRVVSAFRNGFRYPRYTYHFTNHRITMSYSDDNGASWAYLSEPAAEASPINGIWEFCLRNARDGSFQLFYSRELASNDPDTIQRFSFCGGRDVGPPRIQSSEPESPRAMA